MSKRRKQVIYPIGCIGAVLGWLILRDQQPTYEKHDLRYWLAQYREPHSPKEADEAARAVQAIGRNAIPFLVDCNTNQARFVEAFTGLVRACHRN